MLLGVTGSGKTFTMANVIAKVNRPTLAPFCVDIGERVRRVIAQETMSFGIDECSARWAPTQPVDPPANPIARGVVFHDCARFGRASGPGRKRELDQQRNR